ncbi:MAG: lipid-A-disaccharide synthase [Beijerinckiaceae bacterium]
MSAVLTGPPSVERKHMADARGIDVFLIAGEPSGDALGASLMCALGRRAGGARFTGVGGPLMETAGLASLIPMGELSVRGIGPVLRRLPHLLWCVRKIAKAVLAKRPDLVVIIDSPDFTHRVARIVRRMRPDLPIVNYVSPTVWAWRPGRARHMRAYIDHVLALLPFEPAAHRRLGGPACTYVGHPLIERVGALRADAKEARAREASPATLLVMPGSRHSEVRRLMPVFGAALARLANGRPLDLVLPTLSHLEALVRAELRAWPIQPRVVTNPAEKDAAMRRARAALVASGTATLELALAGVPIVVAYRVSLIEEVVARLMTDIESLVLPNLLLGTRIVPEFLQRRCTPGNLADALLPLLVGGLQREAQIAAFRDLDTVMDVGGRSPSEKAAEMIVSLCHDRAPSRAHAF